MLILWLLQVLVGSRKEPLPVDDAIGCSQPGGSFPPVGELAAAKRAALHLPGRWQQQRCNTQANVKADTSEVQYTGRQGSKSLSGRGSQLSGNAPSTAEVTIARRYRNVLLKPFPDG